MISGICGTRITPRAFDLCKASRRNWVKPILDLCKYVVWCTLAIWHFLCVSGGVSQVTVWLPLNMKHGFLITDWHFWQSRMFSCVIPFSLLYPGLFFSFLFLSRVCIFPSISLTQTSSSGSFLLVDCKKTLVLQFMFAPLAPRPTQPQLLPVVHGSGSLPSAKGIYSWNYTHTYTLCISARLTSIVLPSFSSFRGSIIKPSLPIWRILTPNTHI